MGEMIQIRVWDHGKDAIQEVEGRIDGDVGIYQVSEFGNDWVYGLTVIKGPAAGLLIANLMAFTVDKCVAEINEAQIDWEQISVDWRESDKGELARLKAIVDKWKDWE